MAAKHHAGEADARAGALLYRAGNVLEVDLTVTCREWLLAERGPGHLASVFSPAEALALMGLYLRWHEVPVIVGGAPARWHPTAMRRSAAFTALPAFERWNQAGRAWHDITGDLTLEKLNQTCLTRVARAFKFRDSVYGLSATMTDYEPEEMLCELDSLLFSLVGAFDTSARRSTTSCSWARKVVTAAGSTWGKGSGSPGLRNRLRNYMTTPKPRPRCNSCFRYCAGSGTACTTTR